MTCLNAIILMALLPRCTDISPGYSMTALILRHVTRCSTGRRVSLADLMSPKSAPILMRSTPPAWGAAKGASPTNGLPSLRDIQVGRCAPVISVRGLPFGSEAKSVARQLQPSVHGQCGASTEVPPDASIDRCVWDLMCDRIGARAAAGGAGAAPGERRRQLDTAGHLPGAGQHAVGLLAHWRLPPGWPGAGLLSRRPVPGWQLAQQQVRCLDIPISIHPVSITSHSICPHPHRT